MRLFTILFALIISIASSSQSKQDSTLGFENSKRLLNQPLTNFIKVPQPNVAEKDKHLLGKMVSYITKNADSVRTIFEGTVVSIAQVGDSYLVVTNFGSYSITYYGLAKPLFSEGSFLKRNQFISKLSKSSFGQYFLTIQFYKDNVEVDPNAWFK